MLHVNHIKSSCFHGLGITQLCFSSHPRTDHEGRSLLHHAAEGHAAKALQALLKARSAFDSREQLAKGGVKEHTNYNQITIKLHQITYKSGYLYLKMMICDRRVWVTCDVMWILRAPQIASSIDCNAFGRSWAISSINETSIHRICVAMAPRCWLQDTSSFVAGG